VSSVLAWRFEEDCAAFAMELLRWRVALLVDLWCLLWWCDPVDGVLLWLSLSLPLWSSLPLSLSLSLLSTSDESEASEEEEDEAEEEEALRRRRRGWW